MVLTGATGFVGGEVLRQLAERPEIEAITCLTRRAPATRPAEATAVLQADFSVYDTVLLDRLADHSAYIWAMGGKAADLGQPDENYRSSRSRTLHLS